MTRHDKLLDEDARRERAADLIKKARFLIQTNQGVAKKRAERGDKRTSEWILRVYFGDPGVTIGHARIDRGDASGKSLRRRCLNVTVPRFWEETVADQGLLELDNRLVLSAERVDPPPEGGEAAWNIVGVTVTDDCRKGVAHVENAAVVRYGGVLYTSQKNGTVEQAMKYAINQTMIALGLAEEIPF